MIMLYKEHFKLTDKQRKDILDFIYKYNYEEISINTLKILIGYNLLYHSLETYTNDIDKYKADNIHIRDFIFKWTPLGFKIFIYLNEEYIDITNYENLKKIYKTRAYVNDYYKEHTYDELINNEVFTIILSYGSGIGISLNITNNKTEDTLDISDYSKW